jgi:hypothetical protein
MALPGATVSDRSNLKMASAGAGQGSVLSSPVYVGDAASSLVGFYGIAPVAQRAYSSAVHATSALASSSDFGATQLAALQEIQKTLIGLGVWATV